MEQPSTLRPATAADAEFLAWGLDEAARGIFRLMLGDAAPRILARLMAQPDHAFSFAHAVIAESAGVRLGFCQGFPFGTPSGNAEFARAAGIHAFRAAVVAVLGWPVMTATGRHQPGEWYLQAIAVTPEGRSKGVGSALFADAFTRALAAGCSRLVLDVDARNVRARTLYVRLGLAVASTSRSAVLLGGIRTHRMITPV